MPESLTQIPEHYPPVEGGCKYLEAGSCYWCCERCNYDQHTCHFCGASIDHNSNDIGTGMTHGCYRKCAFEDCNQAAHFHVSNEFVYGKSSDWITDHEFKDPYDEN